VSPELVSSQGNESIQKNPHSHAEAQIKHPVSESTHGTQGNEWDSQNSKSPSHHKDQTGDEHSLDVTAMLKQKNADKTLAQCKLHAQANNSRRGCTKTSTGMSRETDMETIRKTVSELAESTGQVDKPGVKMQVNSQGRVTKSNNLKDRLNAFSSSALQESTQT